LSGFSRDQGAFLEHGVAVDRRQGGGSLLSGRGRDRSADHVDGVVGYAVAHGDVDDGFAKLGWWHGRVLS
jgi:hypothetical protein